MCTVSYLRQGDGYTVFFNRDESRSRGPALPPEVRQAGETSYVAARDGDAGGTWLAANEYGLSVGLLNGYHEQDPPTPEGGYTSRGLLVTDLARCASAAELVEHLEASALPDYRAFVLAVWSPGDPCLVLHWSANGLQTEAPWEDERPLVSSSFEPTRVRRTRIETFRRAVDGRAGDSRAEAQVAFHAGHLPARGPLSPCMHRPDAHTVSFSVVTVGAEVVRYEYAPGAPCRTAAEIRRELPRRRLP